MYRFSRAIYREISGEILESSQRGPDQPSNHARVLRACEAAVERLATDRHYFAHPTRTLFGDVRSYFPVSAQCHVLRTIERYVAAAEDFLDGQPDQSHDIYGNPLQCRATTRKGTPCQRAPLVRSGYCPSHQHLAETEAVDLSALAA